MSSRDGTVLAAKTMKVKKGIWECWLFSLPQSELCRKKSFIMTWEPEDCLLLR